VAANEHDVPEPEVIRGPEVEAKKKKSQPAAAAPDADAPPTKPGSNVNGKPDKAAEIVKGSAQNLTGKGKAPKTSPQILKEATQQLGRYDAPRVGEHPAVRAREEFISLVDEQGLRETLAALGFEISAKISHHRLLGNGNGYGGKLVAEIKHWKLRAKKVVAVKDPQVAAVETLDWVAECVVKIPVRFEGSG